MSQGTLNDATRFAPTVFIDHAFTMRLTSVSASCPQDFSIPTSLAPSGSVATPLGAAGTTVAPSGAGLSLRPRASLPISDSTARHAVLAQLPAPEGLRRRLVGAWIDPSVATAIIADARAELEGRGEALADPLECPGPVEFDGNGCIRSLRTRLLTPEIIARLEAAIISPLTQTRSDAPREAPRTPRSILIAVMHLLRCNAGPEATELMTRARKLFLSASFSREGVSRLVGDCSRRLRNEQLHRRFREFDRELKQDVSTPQLADNLYGRTFESLLAEDLVRNPPEGILTAARRLGEGLFGMIEGLDSGAIKGLMHYIALEMRHDPKQSCQWNKGPRPWHALCPRLKEFIRKPSMSTLRPCLVEVTSGVDAVLVPMVVTAAGRGFLSQLPWGMIPFSLLRANDIYLDEIKPQKPKDTSMLVQVEGQLLAHKPGIWLHYQPKVTHFDTLRPIGMDHAHDKVVAPNAASSRAPSGFTKNTLLKGQTMVNGPSGQTWMVEWLGQHLAQQEPDFPLGFHHLNTMMAMVFDGGHSTEEVLYTLKFAEELDQPLASSLCKWLPCLTDEPTSGYEAIPFLLENSADQQALRERLDKALDQTLDYHAEHIARE